MTRHTRKSNINRVSWKLDVVENRVRRNNSPMKDLESRIGLLTRRLNDLFVDNFSSDIRDL